MSLRVLGVLILAAVVPVGAEVDWRFAHPQAEMLMGVKVRALVESPLGDMFREQAKTLGPVGAKLELLDEIEEVYVSVISKRGRNGKVTDSDGLVILVGNFDGGKIMKLLQGPEFQRGGRDVLTPRFIDRTTILLGDEDTMITAVERLKDPKRKGALFTNPLFERASELNDRNHLWMVGSVAPLGAAAGPATGPFSFLNELRSFSFGLGMGEQLHLDVGLNMRTRKAADELIATFQQMQAQMRKQMADPREWDKIAEAMKLSTTGTSLRLEMAMDAKEVRQSMNQVVAARNRAVAPEAMLAQDGAKTGTEPAPQATPNPPAPMRRTVIIYGQEGGPREIPVGGGGRQ